MKSIFVFFVCCLLYNASCLCQTWQWAIQAGTVSYDGGESICIDTMGNSYITGAFHNGIASFGTCTTLSAAGWSDIFVAKYDNNGNCIWAK
ncbi:MAG TPA: hypothetical protein VII99_13185, partial [Bacteroidia bacterium]